MPETLIVHLTDIHATNGELLFGAIDTVARLRGVQRSLEAMDVQPDAIVVSGDLIQTGHSAAYPDLAVAFSRLEHSVGAPVVVVPGNHDHPSEFLRLPQAFGSSRRMVELDRVRLILLDSSSGILGRDQLRWLADVLRDSYRDGSVLVLHHSPAPSPLPALEGTGLRDAAALAEVVAASDARLILAGHYHHALTAQFAGIPVWIGPALSYQQDPTAGAELVRGIDLPQYSLVRLDETGHSAVPVSLDARPALFDSPAHLSTAVITVP